MENSIAVGFFKPNYGFLDILPFFSRVSNFIDTNRCIVANMSENGLLVTYLPINTNWSAFISAVIDKEILSESSFLLRAKEGSFYIRKEKEPYVAVVEKTYKDKYESIRKGLESKFEADLRLFFEEISASELSGIFLKPHYTLKESLKANIPLIDERYNFLKEIDKVHIFLPRNEMKAFGKIFLSQTNKVANLFSPRALRGVNITSNDIPFYISISVNPRLLGDIFEVLSPDTAQAFPSLKGDLSKVLSGSIFITFHSPAYAEKSDLSIFMGVKSKKDADKLLRSILGLMGKYKLISIQGSKVFEIDLQNNNKAYLHLSEKEFVISTKKERIEKYLNSTRASSFSSSKFPTLCIEGILEYIAIVTDRDKESFKKLFLMDVPKGIYIYFDIDDNLNSISFEVSGRYE
ncbi:MAG: hypothetical protein ABDH28_02620 [Brevinematia bacterium]